MKYCPDCGTKIEDPKEGCPNCGYKSDELSNKNNSQVHKIDNVGSDKEIKYEKFEDILKKTAKSRDKNEKYDYYENRSYDTYNYKAVDYVNKEDVSDTKDGPSSSSKILLIVMVVFLNVLGAFVGLFSGILFINKQGIGYKSFGKKLIITSAVFFVLDVAIIRMVFMALKFMMI